MLWLNIVVALIIAGNLHPVILSFWIRHLKHLIVISEGWRFGINVERVSIFYGANLCLFASAFSQDINLYLILMMGFKLLSSCLSLRSKSFKY